MPLPIVIYDNPVLRKKGAKVTVFDHKLREFADEMIVTMSVNNGIGLAAQQVGQALMLCVIDITPRKDEMNFGYTLDGKTPPIALLMPLVLINPVIKLDKSDSNIFNEGCLSFPKLFADVERPVVVECKYQDLEGHAHTLICDGLLSRVIQHEVDHLNGILFIDHLSKKSLKKIQPEIDAIKASH